MVGGIALSLTHCALGRLQLSCLLMCKQYAVTLPVSRAAQGPHADLEAEQGNTALASQLHQVLTTMS